MSGKILLSKLAYGLWALLCGCIAFEVSKIILSPLQPGPYMEAPFFLVAGLFIVGQGGLFTLKYVARSPLLGRSLSIVLFLFCLLMAAIQAWEMAHVSSVPVH